MVNFFNNIIIEPLVVVYDILFVLIYNMVDNAVMAIIALSIVINLIALPLYWKADAIQREEQEKQKKMQYGLNHIRSQFSGDERFMMQSAYYRIEHYNQLNVLKEAGPIALQIPFFIAAYRYISSIPYLENATLGPLSNLLKPDGLVKIGNISVNVLPVIMTLINCVSSYIYTKGQPKKMKVQVYVTALIFLVLLYDSPSGLVIYWITNNLFSLGKNIYYKYDQKLHRIFPLIASILLIVLISIGTASRRIDTLRDVFISECIMAASIAVIAREILRERHVQMPVLLLRGLEHLDALEPRQVITCMLMVELCFVMLLGLYIPSGVLTSSVAEFINQSTGRAQYDLIAYPVTVYFGLFVIWMTVIIFSRERRKRNALVVLLGVLLICAMINHFIFDAKTGVLYSDLLFEWVLSYPGKELILNILVCFAGSVVFVIIMLKKPKWFMRICSVFVLSLAFLGAINIYKIRTEEKQIVPPEMVSFDQKKDVLKLSKNGKNVIVLMLDRAIGGYVPYIFDELPEMKQTYEGFVYYANTVSHGPYTIFGAPGLFGGYEYTPDEMNKRSAELLKDKHDEALKLMPKLFSDNGYKVVITDPPYAGYSYAMDLSIFDDIDNCVAYNLINKYTTKFRESLGVYVYDRQKRNFLIYGVFRTVPLFMKDYVYDNGKYLSSYDRTVTTIFVDNYSTLEMLPEITAFVSEDNGYFLMMQNSLPHSPTPLNPPDYLYDGNAFDEQYSYSDRTVDGKTMKMTDDWDWNHYCVNVASFQLVGKWIKAMKEAGVYDNTRIILVSDHGRNLGQFEDIIHPEGLDVEYVWPLLMVKDFDSHEPFKTSLQFMTNADVPTLAMEGVIKNPINPFTGNEINCDMKQLNQLVTDSEHWTIQPDQTTFDTSDGHWWTVHDSIFDMDNWTKLED